MDKTESIIDANHLENMRLYTVDEMIPILGVSRTTVLVYLRAGKIKGKKIGRRWKVTGENLKNFIEEKNRQ